MQDEGRVLAPAIKAALLTAQRNEITEHWIYTKLAESARDPANGEALLCIAVDGRPRTPVDL